MKRIALRIVQVDLKKKLEVSVKVSVDALATIESLEEEREFLRAEIKKLSRDLSVLADIDAWASAPN